MRRYITEIRTPYQKKSVDLGNINNKKNINLQNIDNKKSANSIPKENKIKLGYLVKGVMITIQTNIDSKDFDPFKYLDDNDSIIDDLIDVKNKSEFIIL